MAKLISKTYGDALLRVAQETNQVDQMFMEVEAVDEVLKGNSKFTKLMNLPKLTIEEKAEILEEIFRDQVDKWLMGLMKLMAIKGHYNEIPSVFDYFICQVKEMKGIGTVTVQSAMPMNEIQKKELETKLLETTKYVSLETDYQVDESLIGGLVIRIGDRVVDGSVKNRIVKLSSELAKIQLKVGEGA